MLSSLSSTIITVFGICHLLKVLLCQPRRSALACTDSSPGNGGKLVPIRYGKANIGARRRLQGARPVFRKHQELRALRLPPQNAHQHQGAGRGSASALTRGAHVADGGNDGIAASARRSPPRRLTPARPARHPWCGG